MRPGDRVTTPIGPGTIVSFVHDTDWAFRLPQRLTWIIVHVDGQAFPQQFAPHEITEEEPMHEETSTETEVDPTQPAPQPEPTEPEPEPTEQEPNNDDNEDTDTKATRRVIIEDEVELVEWP
jgi:hypothetical protein